MTALSIQHQPELQRFVAEPQPGVLCRLDYQRHGDSVAITHTGVPVQLRGHGLASQLVDAAVAWIAPQALQLVPACSYVQTWLQRQRRWQRLMAPPEAQRVLNHWFGVPGSAEDGQIQPRWFQKDAAYDAALRQEFGPLVDRALAGGLDHWRGQPWAALARILVLDQFTRNIHRDTAQAFAGDPQALAAAQDLMTRWQDLTPLQRWFVLMPLEHAEDLAAQEQSVAGFEALVKEDPRLGQALDYARKHLDVIAQFGRFPHRNAVLGRESTAEEREYLARPGAGF